MTHTLAVGKKLGSPWWYRPKPITLEGALNKHLLCYGQPGSGKSSFIYHQLLQDVRNKNPFILFDTHQDLFRQALAALISHNWQPSEVILIDVHDYRRLGVPGLHLLEPREQQEPAQVVAIVLYAFRELWRDSWGYRMEDIPQRDVWV